MSFPGTEHYRGRLEKVHGLTVNEISTLLDHIEGQNKEVTRLGHENRRLKDNWNIIRKEWTACRKHIDKWREVMAAWGEEG